MSAEGNGRWYRIVSLHENDAYSCDVIGMRVTPIRLEISKIPGYIGGSFRSESGEYMLFYAVRFEEA